MGTRTLLLLTVLVGCAPAPPRPAPMPVMYAPPAPTATAAPPPAPPPAAPLPIALADDPCLATSHDLAKPDPACRCVSARLALPGVGGTPPRPREACTWTLTEEAERQLRITTAATPKPRGEAIPIVITVENTGPDPVVLRLTEPWWAPYPDLLNAKDAAGRRVDQPAGECVGSRARPGGALRSIETFWALVLEPGGKAQHHTSWHGRRARYLRDGPPSKDEVVQLARAMDPCRVEGGAPLPAGRYRLQYEHGLMLDPRLVDVAVTLR